VRVAPEEIARAREVVRERRAQIAAVGVGNPIEVNMFDGESFRREDCTRYRGCLEFAVAKSWRAFGCGDCQSFAPSTETRRAADEINRSTVEQQQPPQYIV
jgi:hypothetical protein